MDRRMLIKKTALSATALIGASQLAQAGQGACSQLKTPKQTEGPFYPVIAQVDTDADLIRVAGANVIAKGQIILVRGQVKAQDCAPVAGALVEIWQACESGRYNHPSDTNPAPLDKNFQYWGKATTDINGFYQFRTIVPGAYPADTGWVRPPHIHFKITRLGYMELTTQLYFEGQALNEKDLILQRLSAKDRGLVISKIASVAGEPHPIAKFDITLEKITRY